MNKAKDEALKQYEKACQSMADIFISHYYTDDEIKYEDVDWFWVSSEIGGTLFVGDEFYSMRDLVQIFRHKPTKDQMLEYYYYSFEERCKNKPPMTLKNWLIFNKK